MMFADLHIHMILDGVDFRTAIGAHRNKVDDALLHERLRAYRERGVTFLRDGGDAWGVCLRARELARDYGIDYRCPAFPIFKRGHYGSFIGRGFDTVKEYSTLLDEAEEKEADFVKLMISGLIDFSRPNTLTEDGISADEIHEMIDLAHRRGFAVMVHANGDKAVNAALDAGAESVEHGAFLSEKTLLRMNKILWVPTLSTIGNLIGCGRYPDSVLTELLRQQTKNVRFVHAHGGLIGLGSDAGAYCVKHAQAVSDERSYLSAVSDACLRKAENEVRRRFHR